MAEANGQHAAGPAARDRKTRRRVLVGAAGVLGVATAEVVGQAAPAQANNGNPVLQGTDNGYPTHRTAVFTNGNNEWAQLADPGDAGLGSLGIYAHGQDIGVLGEGGGSAAVGVKGLSGPGGVGVYGTGGSGSGAGVEGQGGSGGGVGVAAFGGGGFAGVLAVGDGTAAGVECTGGINAAGVAGTGGGRSGVGVSGQGSGGGTGAGVTGTGGSGGGPGVTGTGTGSATGVIGTGGPSNGVGVAGTGGGSTGHGVTGAGSGSGAGVWGTAGGSGGTGARGTASSASSTGVLAENTGGGTALAVTGPAVFSRSGLLTVAAGKSSATQTGVALTGASLVLATLQQNLPGVSVRAAIPNVTSNSFTIYLSKAPSVSAKVAWFVVN